MWNQVGESPISDHSSTAIPPIFQGHCSASIYELIYCTSISSALLFRHCILYYLNLIAYYIVLLSCSGSLLHSINVNTDKNSSHKFLLLCHLFMNVVNQNRSQQYKLLIPHNSFTGLATFFPTDEK